MSLYTAIHLVLLACFLLGVAATYVGWKIAPQKPGTRLWFLGMVTGLVATGITVLGFTQLLEVYVQSDNHQVSIFIRSFGAWFACVSWFLTWLGYREFLHLSKPSTEFIVLVSVLLLILMFVGSVFGFHNSWQISLVGLVLVIGAICIFMDFQKQTQLRPAAYFTQFAMLAVALSWSIRSLVGFIEPTDNYATELAFWVVFISIIATVSALIGMVLLIASVQNQHLRELASVDSLTNILNRRSFFIQADHSLALAIRKKQSVSVAMLDLDYFKRVNDHYGHLCGDKLLQHFTALCQRALRNQDIFARYGGEEFIVLLPDTSVSESIVVIQRIKALVRQEAFFYQNESIDYTISVGISSAVEDVSINSLIEEADKALYIAKNNGRNKIVCEGMSYIE